MKPTAMSVQEQIDELRMIGDSRAVGMMLPACVLVAIAGFAAAFQADSETPRVLYLFVAGCSSLIALAAGFGVGHVRNAAAGTRKGRREPAELHLFHGQGDEDSEAVSGLLTPASRHAQAWRMDFAICRGWAPPAGHLQVDAVYLSDIAWPVLLVHQDGILWPRGRPRAEDKPGQARVRR